MLVHSLPFLRYPQGSQGSCLILQSGAQQVSQPLSPQPRSEPPKNSIGYHQVVFPPNGAEGQTKWN